MPTEINFKTFTITVKDADYEKFIDEIETLCKKYATKKGTNFVFLWD